MCSILFGLLPWSLQSSDWLCLAFRRRKPLGLSTLGRSRRFAAARSSVPWRALAAHPFQHLAKRFAERFAKRLAAEALRLLLRKLANGKVRLLLARASFTEGYTLDLHHRLVETWTLRPASHLAGSLLLHCIDQEHLPPTIRDSLLVIRTPPVSTPATNRSRTLRKDISSLETGIAAVRQAYDRRPVRLRCRLLRFLFGGECLGLHLHFLP